MIRICLIVVLVFFIPMNTYCQLGINTVNPKATLDVVGHPDDPKIADGLRAPHLTLAQIHTKTYNTSQTGDIVYITNTDLDTRPLPLPDAYSYISAPGYYFFDGTMWNPLEAQIGDVIFNATLGNALNNNSVQSIGNWTAVGLDQITTNIGGGIWNDESGGNVKYSYVVPVSGTYLVSAGLRYVDNTPVQNCYINVDTYLSDLQEGNWQIIQGSKFTSTFFKIRYYKKGTPLFLYGWALEGGGPTYISSAFLYLIILNTVG